MSGAPPAPDSLAVLGVGALAEAIVDGLCRDGEGPTIVLSPRNAERAARLAERHSSVTVAADNQAAIDAASVVVVCVRPQVAEEVLGALRFRPDHEVVSVMAATSLERLAALVSPAGEVSRSVPAPAVADGRGVTPVFPAGSAADRLFARLGRSVVLGDEPQLDATQTAASTVATFLAYLATASGWLVEQGVDAEQARVILSGLFAGVAEELPGASSFEALRAEHATPGGLNDRLERRLRTAGLFDLVSQGLDGLRSDPLGG